MDEFAGAGAGVFGKVVFFAEHNVEPHCPRHHGQIASTVDTAADYKYIDDVFVTSAVCTGPSTGVNRWLAGEVTAYLLGCLLGRVGECAHGGAGDMRRDGDIG